jgi:hypothetical protein
MVLSRFGRRTLVTVPMCLFLVVGIAVGIAETGCGTDAVQPPLGISSRTALMQQPTAAPIIKAGDLRSQGLWNDPCVLKEGGQYILYMTTSVNKPFEPPVLPFRAVSTDGISWQLAPPTPLMTASGTSFKSIETPSVIKFAGRYHLYFTGVMADTSGPPMSVGHAQSDDGLNWTVTPDPVIKATGNPNDWNGYLVGEPGAIVRGNEVFVYFSAVGARQSGKPPQRQTIGLARSPDGVNFSPPVIVLEQSSLYSAAQGFAGYSAPSAFEYQGKIHLLYDVVLFRSGAEPEWQQVALHHAAAADGVRGFAQDDKPLLTRDDFAWTSGEILAPTALVDGNNLKMWFAGHVRRDQLAPLVQRDFSGGEFGIGYAVLPLAVLQ